MATWMSGYVADVAYTLGFYRELAPSFLHFACLINGVDAPPLGRPMRYCELGCGRGYGTALLAAANPDVEFVGVDFNPSHIAEARSLASRAGLTNVTFMEMGFGDAARSSDPRLSNFDVVVLHGVYTWVAASVRKEIDQFIRDKLLAGGVVYNSYNAMPGWANAVPIQHLLMEVANRSSRDSMAAIKEGLELLGTLSEKNSAFVGQSPGIKARIERMRKQDPAYLVHEFLNAGWQALFVTEVIANFSEAKLTYVGSATLLENRLDLCVPKDLQPIVAAAPDVAMREMLKDFVINKQFRRDIYVKGPQTMSARDQRQGFDKLVFAATGQSKDLPEKFPMPIGEVTPKKETLAALTATMAEKPATGAELIAAGAKAGIREGDVILLILLLVNGSIITPGRADHAGADRSASRRLNDLMFELAPAADSHRFVTSPVLGSAIPAAFVDRLIAPLVLKSPKADDAEIARQTFDRIAKAGQSFRRDGKALEKTDENVASIVGLVKEFREQRLPRWRALGVVDGKGK
ncbi:MAG: class I SAM-dependent methyltransferase [Pseudolabrys sp.]